MLKEHWRNPYELDSWEVVCDRCGQGLFAGSGERSPYVKVLMRIDRARGQLEVVELHLRYVLTFCSQECWERWRRRPRLFRREREKVLVLVRQDSGEFVAERGWSPEGRR